MSLFRYRLTKIKEGITDLLDYIDGLIAEYNPHEHLDDTIRVPITRARLNGDKYYGIQDGLRVTYARRYAICDDTEWNSMVFVITPLNKEKKKLLQSKADGRSKEELEVAMFLNSIPESDIEDVLTEEENTGGWRLKFQPQWDVVKNVVGDVEDTDEISSDDWQKIHEQFIDKYSQLYPEVKWVGGDCDYSGKKMFAHLT